MAAKAAENLQVMAHVLQIAGCRDGYFKPEQEAEVVAQIAATHPAALLLLLGTLMLAWRQEGR